VYLVDGSDDVLGELDSSKTCVIAAAAHPAAARAQAAAISSATASLPPGVCEMALTCGQVFDCMLRKAEGMAWGEAAQAAVDGRQKVARDREKAVRERAARVGAEGGKAGEGAGAGVEAEGGKAEAPPAEADFSTMKVAELRQELAKRGLDKSGTKAVLVARLSNSGGEVA
jgi:hypothetical protein